MSNRQNEAGYLSLVNDVLTKGRLSENRTGIRTLSLFGDQLRYCLRDNKLAMLTTKFVSFSSVFYELLWFIRGETNQKTLADKNVHIWRANSTREFLDSRKLYHYKEFESLGPIYGFQWRHFGAKYYDSYTSYVGQGVDQLKNCIHQIRNEPNSRRIIMSAWNPVDLNKMVLPPCHVMFQFEVDQERKELSGHLYQRSADLLLGVPYNLLSYSLLLHIIAHKCSLSAGDLVCSYGNVHVYENHIENAKIQLSREPLTPPQIVMRFNKDTNIEDLTLGDFIVKDYNHHGKLNFKMAV